ncbi:MAG: GntR family transcriptional regulator [Helcococcus sp.]|nr:GntR family transcriptional regulator [Helcococcus sp.]
MDDYKTLHEKISADIRKKIITKEYRVNETIPKEIDLANHYGVSRPTVRQAIQTLVDEGYLERKKGTGTFVRQKKINQDFIHIIRSYEDELKSRGFIPITKVINFSIEKADEEIAKKLRLNIDDPIYTLTRLRYANDEPAVFVITHIPFKLYDNLLDVDFTKSSLYSTFEKYNRPIYALERELSVIKSTYISSAMLNIPVGDPLFYFKTIGYSKDKTPIEYSISWYRGDYNSFEIRINM